MREISLGCDCGNRAEIRGISEDCQLQEQGRKKRYRGFPETE